MSDSFRDRGVIPSVPLSGAALDGLRRANPSSLGVDADAIVAFLNDVEAANLELHAVMIHRHGNVVAEAWRWPYRADRLRNLHSAAKSFTACAIGLAIEEGHFRLDDKIVSFFPEALPEVVGDGLTAMTIEDLLTMRVGHGSSTSGARWRGIGTSWTEAFFRIPVVERPGSAFLYTSAASYMLSAVLSRATGETLHDYLKPRLFDPLGITGEIWDVGPDGINPGGNGLWAKTADLLKLGILHAQDGVWEGKRLLPSAWVTSSTRPHIESGRYGYHWWTHPDGAYSARGVFVQMAMVFPEHGATLAVTGAINGSAKLLPFIDRYFPAAFGAVSKDGGDADARLAAKLAQWQKEDAPIVWKEPYLRARQPVGAIDGARTDAGVWRFATEPNAQGIEELQFEFTDSECTFRLTDVDGQHVIVAGLGHWIEAPNEMPGSDLHHNYQLRGSPVLARACWLDTARLQMTWIFAETAFRDTIVCEFSGNKLLFKREVNVNSGETRHDDLIGTLRA